MLKRNQVYHLDWLALCQGLEDQSVDAFITDLPYGTTACTWDEIIPFAPMWEQVKRTLKPRGVFVTTASQPFTSKLVMSNLDWFKYEWIWEKTNGTNFLNAPFQPLKTHENGLVFADAASSFSPAGSMAYYPQVEIGLPYISDWRFKEKKHTYHTSPTKDLVTQNEGTRYPRSVLRFNEQRGLHPTQKPVALYEYLIKTYTQEGDLVVDFCAGSGTTAIAARNLKRDYIIGDSDGGYVLTAQDRLRTSILEPRQVKPGSDDVSDLPLFKAGK